MNERKETQKLRNGWVLEKAEFKFVFHPEQIRPHDIKTDISVHGQIAKYVDKHWMDTTLCYVCIEPNKSSYKISYGSQEKNKVWTIEFRNKVLDDLETKLSNWTDIEGWRNKDVGVKHALLEWTEEERKNVAFDAAFQKIHGYMAERKKDFRDDSDKRIALKIFAESLGLQIF